MGMTKRPISDRFWEKVIKKGPDECWLWKGRLHSFGHGDMVIDGHAVGAHRVSYMLNIGEIPKNYCVCHSCDVPNCVNPKHLFLGTVKDNMDDMNSKGHNFFQPGHELNIGENNARSILTEEDVNYIRSNSDRYTAKELSKKFNVSESSIHRAVRGETWNNVLIPPLKRRPGRSKLSMEQVLEICQKSDFKTITMLGREYGVTPTAIRYCINKFKSLR